MSGVGNKRILFLYAEVMGYTVALLRALSDLGFELHVVHWDKRKLTNYKLPQLPNITFYPRSSMTSDEIVRFATSLEPEITVVSGIQDKGYLRPAARLRRMGKIVVSGFDTKWIGGVKQSLARLIGKFGFFKLFFSHAWVPGPQQYEFVRRLGFRDQEILSDLYSADTSAYAAQELLSRDEKTEKYPHQFLFVGRLEPEKGLNTLKEAWLKLGNHRGDWRLLVVGSGSLESSLGGVPAMTIQGFMQPSELVSVVASTGCFVLPSVSEPWGVVVHEFAAAGLPMVLSSEVGSARAFLIPGLNGYSFKSGDVDSLSHALLQVIRQSDATLSGFGEASSNLARRITPFTSAANLSGLLYRRVKTDVSAGQIIGAPGAQRSPEFGATTT